MAHMRILVKKWRKLINHWWSVTVHFFKTTVHFSTLINSCPQFFCDFKAFIILNGFCIQLQKEIYGQRVLILTSWTFASRLHSTLHRYCGWNLWIDLWNNWRNIRINLWADRRYFQSHRVGFWFDDAFDIRMALRFWFSSVALAFQRVLFRSADYFDHCPFAKKEVIKSLIRTEARGCDFLERLARFHQHPISFPEKYFRTRYF